MAYAEPRPYEETDHEGRLNPNSYAATAVWTLTATAVAAFSEAGLVVNPKKVTAYAQTLAKICEDVQAELRPDGSASYQEGSHSRVRHALHETLRTLPPPLDEASSVEDWAGWVTAATRRVRAICKIAEALWAEPLPEAPWTVLATDPTPAAAAA
jgi:hypothetical protein